MRKRKFDDGGDVTADSKEVLLPEAEAAGLRAGPRAKNTFVQEGEPPKDSPKAAPKKQMLEPNRDSGETIGPQGMQPIAREKPAATAKPIPKQNPDLPKLQPKRPARETRKNYDMSGDPKLKYAGGGVTRGDGCAQRGKTRGRMV